MLFCRMPEKLDRRRELSGWSWRSLSPSEHRYDTLLSCCADAELMLFLCCSHALLMLSSCHVRAVLMLSTLTLQCLIRQTCLQFKK